MKARFDYLLSLPDMDIEKELEEWTLSELEKMLKYIKENVNVLPKT